MADWSKPTTGTAYENWPSQVKERDIDAITLLEGRSPTNLVDKAKKINTSVGRIESWDAGASSFNALKLTHNEALTYQGSSEGYHLSQADQGLVAGLSHNLENLSDSEVQQLQNIDTKTISNTQWGYLGQLDQRVDQGGAPSFVKPFPYNNRPGVRTLTSATTLTTDDHGKLIELDYGGGSFDVTLPTHSTGLKFSFIVINGANSGNIDDNGGSTVHTMTFLDQVVTLVSDGAGWQKILPVGLYISEKKEMDQDFYAVSTGGAPYCYFTRINNLVTVTIASQGFKSLAATDPGDKIQTSDEFVPPKFRPVCDEGSYAPTKQIYQDENEATFAQITYTGQIIIYTYAPDGSSNLTDESSYAATSITYFSNA